MIDLLKLNLLDAKRHFLYTRTKEKSIEMIKDVFKNIKSSIELAHFGKLTDKEVDDIKKDLCEKCNVVSDRGGYSGPISYLPINRGALGTLNGWTTTYNNNTFGNLITNGSNNSNIYIKGTMTFPDPQKYYIIKMDYNNIIPNSIFDPYEGDFRIFIIDNLNLFLNSINSDIDNYYYIGKKSYKSDELLNFIDKILLGET